MKKLLFTVLILFTLSMSLSAVDFTIGPKATFGDYSYRGDDWKTMKNNYDIKDEFSPSFSGGVFFITHFSPLFSIQVDGLYSYQTMRNEYTSISEWEQYNFSSIGIPIYARFDFQAGSVNLFLLAGPRFDILFDKYTYKDSLGNTGSDSLSDNDFNSFMVGISLGGGVSFTAGPGKMEVGVVYNSAFTKTDPDYEIFGNGFELQLGYGFSLSGNNNTNTSSGSGKSNSW